MHLLLDTHSLVWWKAGSSRLSPRARMAIEDAEAVHVSVATAWEIAIKVGLGKLPEARDLLMDFDKALDEEGFRLLPISVEHARFAGLINSTHRDPFDRLLAAQSQTEGLTLITTDSKLQALGATVVW